MLELIVIRKVREHLALFLWICTSLFILHCLASPPPIPLPRIPESFVASVRFAVSRGDRSHREERVGIWYNDAINRRDRFDVMDSNGQSERVLRFFNTSTILRTDLRANICKRSSFTQLEYLQTFKWLYNGAKPGSMRCGDRGLRWQWVDQKSWAVYVVCAAPDGQKAQYTVTTIPVGTGHDEFNLHFLNFTAWSPNEAAFSHPSC